MRRSEFFLAVDDEFGEYGRILLAELSLTACGGLTALAALEQGIPPRDIWLELCRMQDIPENRRYGVGLRPLK